MDNGLAPIILIDDNQSDIDLTKRAFKQANVPNPIATITDGEEALDFLLAKGKHANRNKFKLPAFVLLDLNMPGLNGHEVLKKIRNEEDLNGLVVVMLTSSREEKDISLSYKVGVNSYISKPVDFVEFVDLIKHTSNYWLSINASPMRII